MKFFVKVIFLVLLFQILVVDNQNSIFLCPAIGNFDDPTDSTCTKYYKCTRHNAKQTECPVSQYFNPETEECSQNYVCPSSNLKPEPHVCESIGIFPDLTDSNCSKYIVCKQKYSEFKALTFRCLHGFQFDPFLRFCNMFYKCPSKQIHTEIPKSTTTISHLRFKSSVLQCDPTKECSKNGIFVREIDDTCNIIYSCECQSSGTFKNIIKICPKDTKEKCIENYKCSLQAWKTLISTETTRKIAKLFELIQYNLSRDVVSETQMVFQFIFTGEEAGKWYIDLKNGDGACGTGDAPSQPDVTLTMDSNIFLNICLGKTNPIAAYVTGDLKIRGSFEAARKLNQLMLDFI